MATMCGIDSGADGWGFLTNPKRTWVINRAIGTMIVDVGCCSGCSLNRALFCSFRHLATVILRICRKTARVGLNLAFGRRVRAVARDSR